MEKKMLQKKISFHSFLPGLVVTIILFIASTFIRCTEDPASQGNDENSLKYVIPEDVGYSSEKLDEAKQFAETTGFASMMALYDGKVFFSWGDITRNYKCHSIRKPFLSSLYGIYVTNGVIDLDETLEELGIDDIPPGLTSEEKQAKVRDLLKARSGVYHEAAAETQEMKEMRPERGSHPPGTFFYYNNWDFNVLGTIFEQKTGTKIFEEFEKRIAEPIGMEDFSIENCYYQYEENLSMHPAYSFRMSTRDMARFGLLYQQDGIWESSRIVPSEWIHESTTTFSIVDSTAGVGYGYLWTTIPEGSAFEQLIGSSGYYHTGVGVHIVMILPEQNLVIVQRYDTDNAWVDPGNAGMELGLMVINARIPGKSLSEHVQLSGNR